VGAGHAGRLTVTATPLTLKETSSMTPAVFDWRDDPMGTIVAVPPIRARFMRFEPGFAQTEGHSHEQSGGWELFLCLEGALEFTIDGVPVVITAGQALTAAPWQVHILRCVSDVPAILYLSVTPHVPPTHTWYDEHGNIVERGPGVTNPTWKGEPALTAADFPNVRSRP
jgi:quercetin dioxygenase-like cupin family protein